MEWCALCLRFLLVEDPIQKHFRWIPLQIEGLLAHLVGALLLIERPLLSHHSESQNVVADNKVSAKG